MNKKILTLLTAFVIIVLPLFSVSAEAIKPAIRLSCSVDGSMPSDKKFEITVKKYAIDEADDDAEPVSTDKLTIDTASAADKEYAFAAGDIGLYKFDFYISGCSDSSIASDGSVVTVYPGQDEIRVSYPDREETFDLANIENPPVVTVKGTKVQQVKIELADNKTVSKVYDGKTSVSIPADCYKLIGVVSGDDVKLAYKSAVFNSPDVKSAKRVKVTGLSLTGNDAAKYKLATESFEITGKITARPITVTANDIVITEGANEPELTYTLSEQLIEGNSAVGTLARTAGSEAGSYIITRGTLTFGDNYEVTFVEGHLTVSSYTLVEVIDQVLGIKISGYIDKSSSVSAVKLAQSDGSYKALADAAGSVGHVIAAYNIMLDTPKHDGDLTVTFPVDAKYEGKQIYIYQLMSSGAVSSYKTAAVDGTVSLKTSECTQFAIVAEGQVEAKPMPKTSVGKTALKVILILLAVALGLALLIALFFFGMVFFNKTDELKRIIKKFRRLFKKNKR